MEDTANMESTDPPSYLAESTVRIKELHEAEKVKDVPGDSNVVASCQMPSFLFERKLCY